MVRKKPLSSFGKDEVAGVFRLPEGKKIMPDMQFEYTNMAKGDGLAPEKPLWASASSRDDMGFRAHQHASMARAIVTTPITFKSTFDSKTLRKDHTKKVSGPGFLEYSNTPRASPSMSKALTKPANNIMGAENELTYHSTFKTKYEWPKSELLPAYGGSILKQFDSAQGQDRWGKFQIMEKSIAKDIDRSGNRFSATFRSKTALGIPIPVSANPPIPYREMDVDFDHPLYMARTVEKSPHKYSAMTLERGSLRKPPERRSETVRALTLCPSLLLGDAHFLR